MTDRRPIQYGGKKRSSPDLPLRYVAAASANAAEDSFTAT